MTPAEGARVAIDMGGEVGSSLQNQDNYRANSNY